MAPVPKKKHSKSRTGRRRGNISISKPSLTVCSSCKSKKLPHKTCPSCGAK
ncbi:50S ribosomal protein L32 [Candidatus Microgenomates bacterium]|nr:MAG: 50S ribosomal protein L32 [Candidatus Microgenomates bacterium]